MGLMGGARLTLSTGSFYNMGLDRAFAIAAEAGYDGVELLVDGRQDSYDVPYLRGLSARTGMAILSVHTPFLRRINGWPDAQEERIVRAVALAEDLGAETVVAHTPGRWHSLHVEASFLRRDIYLDVPLGRGSEARYARWLEKELPLVQQGTAVRIAIENMPAGRLWGFQAGKYRYNRPAELARWPYLVLDTTHWGTWGLQPMLAYQELKGRIAHVHLSDYDGLEHRLPFKGRLDLASLLTALQRDGFGGTVAVELNPWAIAEGNWAREALVAPLRETAQRCRELLGLPASHSQVTQAAQPADGFPISRA